MSTQPIAPPSHRRTVIVVIALLFVVLAVGAVTAVNLFPARADVEPAPAAGAASVGGPRVDARVSRPLSRSRVSASVAVTSPASWSGPLGRLDDRASLAVTSPASWSGPLGR